MADSPRRVAVTRKISLGDIADNFDDCYAVVRLASFDQVRELRSTNDVEKMTNDEAVQMMLDVAKSNFVTGKIMVLNEANELNLVDMTADDIASSTAIINKLYLTIMGVTLDPKATPTSTAISPTLTATSEPSIDENNTRTISSTTSVQ